jgi:uncharacterized protein (TIRG00374 family)
VVWFARGAIDWRMAVTALRSASVPLVLIAGLVTLSSVLIKAIRWWIFLRRSTKLSVGHVVRLTFVGSGVNSVLAANAGDVARVSFATRAARVPMVTVLATLASDKATDVAAFVTMCLGLVLVDSHRWGAVALPWIVGAVVVIAAGLVLLRVRSSSSPSAVIERVRPAFLRSGARNLSLLVGSTRAHLRDRDAAVAYALSLLSWSAQVGTYALGARAVGLHIPVTGAVAAVVAVNLAGVLRATPGNVGVFQIMYTLALLPYGVPHSVALTAAVLVQLVQICTALLAGSMAFLSAASR